MSRDLFPCPLGFLVLAIGSECPIEDGAVPSRPMNTRSRLKLTGNKLDCGTGRHSQLPHVSDLGLGYDSNRRLGYGYTEISLRIANSNVS